LRFRELLDLCQHLAQALRDLLAIEPPSLVQETRRQIAGTGQLRLALTERGQKALSLVEATGVQPLFDSPELGIFEGTFPHWPGILH
jgi:hypothetical protein